MRYNKVLEHSLKLLINNELINRDNIIYQYRPPFYNKYTLRVTISIPTYNFYEFTKLKNEFENLTKKLCYFQSNSRTLTFYFYSSDPALLRVLYAYAPTLIWGTIVIVKDECHNMTFLKSKRKRKYKFYNKYNYRIEFKPKHNIYCDVSEFIKNNCKEVYRSPFNPNMVYVKTLNELILTKIYYNDYIKDIKDRSNCPVRKK